MLNEILDALSGYFLMFLKLLERLPLYFTKNPKELLYDWMGGNEVLFLGINGIRGSLYDKIMQKISWLGEHEHFPYICAGLLCWVCIMSLYKLVTRQVIRHYLSMWLGIFLVLGIGYGVNGIVIKSLKNHYAYPRPYVAMASVGKVYKLEETKTEEHYRSFPSGHVAFVTLLVIALWPVLSSKAALAGLGFILLMAWSRISLGMHFPADVISSVLITTPLIWLISFGVHRIMQRMFRIRC